MTALFAILGIGIGLIAVYAVAAIFHGWVFSQLWEWFAVTTFGAPSITVFAAIGISLLFSFYQIPNLTKGRDKTSAEKWGEVIGLVIFKPLLYLLIGWIVFCFMK